MKRAHCAGVVLVLLASVARADLSPGGWEDERPRVPYPEQPRENVLYSTEYEHPPLSNTPVYAGVALSMAVVLAGLYMIRYVRVRDKAWRHSEQE